MGFPLEAIGAGLSGVGSILGAFGVGRGGGPDLGAQQQFSMQQLQMQEQFQREMAQNSIQWRVNDAKAAGISPLVALGAPTFSPTLSVGGVDYSASRSGGSDVGGALARGGAALGDLAKNISQRDLVAAQLEVNRQQLDRQNKLTDAEVALKGAQAAYFASKTGVPSAPSVITETGGLQGQGNVARSGPVVDGGAGGNRNQLPDPLTHVPGNAGVVSGRAGPADQPYWTRDGTVEIQPSAGSPAAQGDIVNSVLNALRNRLPGIMQPSNDPSILRIIRQQYPEATGYKREGFGYYRPTFPGGYVLGRDGNIHPEGGYR